MSRAKDRHLLDQMETEDNAGKTGLVVISKTCFRANVVLENFQTFNSGITHTAQISNYCRSPVSTNRLQIEIKSHD